MNKKIKQIFFAIIIIFSATFITCYQPFNGKFSSIGIEEDLYARYLTSIGEVTNYTGNGGNNPSLVIPYKEDGSAVAGRDDSFLFRIPTMVVIPPNAILPNGERIGPSGRIVLTVDDRFMDFQDAAKNSGPDDLPQKCSVAYRISDDGGKTWGDVKLMSHIDDLNMSSFKNKKVSWGVSAGDPSIGITSDNTLVVLSTYVPFNTGYMANCKVGNTNLDNNYGMKNKNGNSHFKIGDKWFLRLQKNDVVYDSLTDNIDLSNEDFKSKCQSKDYNGCFKNLAKEDDEANDQQFPYAVPVTGGEIKKLKHSNANGNWQIDDYESYAYDSGSGTGIYVDEYYYMYKDANFTQPIMVPQLDCDGNDVSTSSTGDKIYNKVKLGNKDVPCHLFMLLSPFMPWRGCNYVCMNISKDGGKTWTKNKDITYMVRPPEKGGNTEVFFVSPTGGFLGTKGRAKDNLYFAAYCASAQNYQDGNQSQRTGFSVCVFWTSDNGKTWTICDDGWIKNKPLNHDDTSSISETSFVEAPDGSLLAVHRDSNSSHSPEYSVSTDGGKTWVCKGQIEGTESQNKKPAANNLVSATNLRKSVGPNGESLVALSFANNNNGNRTNGRVFILGLQQDGDSWKFDWKNEKETAPINDDTHSGKSDKKGDFCYSCVRELPDGNLILAWEGDNFRDINLSFISMIRDSLYTGN